MRNAISSFLRPIVPETPLKVTLLWVGNAATVDMFTWLTKLPRFVPYARIPEHTLKEKWKTTDYS